MGVSTDGQICFGIAFGEDFEFPWFTEEDDEAEGWWVYKVCGYKNPFQIYNDSGEYLDGVEPASERVKEYHDSYYKFLKAHPFPFELVNYCSYDYPMYMLAIKSTCTSNSRGYPKSFDPTDMVIDQGEIDKLLNFCHEYGIEMPEPPKWWLSSFWG